jgi:hypothetical protein
MLFRVTEPGRPAFQLRKGEEGISVFDSESVDPPLSETEVLAAFRPGSMIVVRILAELGAKGLVVVAVPGSAVLPERLRTTHAEIRPGPALSRTAFKLALKELE